jgi:hypothetical protein
MLTLTTQLINLNSEVYYQALHVPAEAVKELLKDTKDQRMVCRLETGYEWQCALMPLGDGDFFINVNKEIRAANGLADNQKNVVIQLKKDESEYGMPVPEELIELWAMDQEGWAIFNTLTPGKQRSLLYQIGKPKNSETRLKKAVQVTDYLKSTGGKLDFKELNAYMKEHNQR